MLQPVPDGKHDWKPHARSMAFGYLALLVGGRVVMESPRHEVIRETFNHLAHHRGPLTVDYRLLGVTVPAPCGPPADEQKF